MPAWGNTDTANNKPKIPLNRQVREVIRLNVTSTANTTDATSNVLTFATGSSDVANGGISAGWSVFSSNVNIGTGISGYFTSNTTVLSTTANTVTLNKNISGNIVIGTTIEFDAPITWGAADSVKGLNTILVTPTRMANAITGMANAVSGQGWVRIVKKTNGGGGGDSSVRYMNEVLVALANPVAANTNSGNTSTTQIYTGL